jgi:REP element-mobilizing transposase RayT
MRKIELANGELYHIFNRGVDKRNIFADKNDLERFFQCMQIFNVIEPIGSLYEYNFLKPEEKQKPKKHLVRFVAYCLLPNHFHFIIQQATDNGISKFMKRLLGGYSWYFNHKKKRSGVLFEGTFKAVHINSNEQLLHTSAYVNLNDKQKNLFDGRNAKKTNLVKSSWEEYIEQKNVFEICAQKGLVLGQFRSKSEYKKFVLDSLKDIRNNKEKYKDLE